MPSKAAEGLVKAAIHNAPIRGIISQEAQIPMNDAVEQELLTERALAMAYDMGLSTAVYVLERAENLSPEGRKCMVNELKSRLKDTEIDYTHKLLSRSFHLD